MMACLGYSFQIAKNCLVKEWLINSKSWTRDSQFQKKKFAESISESTPNTPQFIQPICPIGKNIWYILILKNSHHTFAVRGLNYVTYLKWGFSGFWGSAVTLSGVSEETFPYLMPGLFDASISSVTSWPRPHSEEPHCFSTKTRRTKSPSSPCLKVQGTMQNRPSGSIIRLLTSLRFTNVSVRST